MREVARAAFLPMDRRHALAVGFALPERTEGAVLFADLAGFTRLSRDLTAAHGRRLGVDVLSEVLDTVYAAVIAEIHAHAGSVIGFSGDAVTCWFDDRPRGTGPDPVAGGAARAVACGRRLVAAMAGLPAVEVPEREPVALAVKVAVASGAVTRALVGDPEHQVVEVIGGATVARVADLEQVARHGEVVVDDATVAASGATAGEVRTTPSGPGTVVAAAPPVAATPWVGLGDGLPDDAVRPWVGWQIRDRADAALTELRPTVALFVGFTPLDLDADPAAASADLDRFVRWVQAVIAPADGNLIQVTVGDKRSYLYISFGAPRSHEDLADRAAGAALALVAPPDDLAAVRPLRLGIAHGTTRVGAYGSPESATYGALGDGTNLAARLMSAAPDEGILLSRRIADACGPSFRTEPREPIAAKGFDTPVEVVQLVGRTAYLAPDAAHQRPLVGRTRELSEVVRRVAAVAGGPGGTTLVAGEAGSGKSHLVAEVKRRVLADTDVTWFAGQADELVRTALHPFLGILRDLTFVELATTTEDRLALFDATVDALVEDVTARGGDDVAARLDRDRSFLAALLGLHRPGSPYELHDPRGRFARCLAAYDSLIRAESVRRPVVVHIADAQWLDDESAELLTLLRAAAREAGVAVLLDERTEAGGSATALGDDLDDAVTVVVGPLDRDGVRELVASRLGGPPSDELVAVLQARSQGGPLFVEQLLADLTERGQLGVGAEGRWVLTGAAESELPVSLSTVLVSRLDRLPADTVAVVQRAAVLGVEVATPVLTMVADDVGDVGVAVETAAGAGIWDVEGERGDRLAFRHALLRDAAYEMQPAARLRESHARAAAALSILHHDADAVAPALAHHHERAGAPGRALVQLRRAAAAAQRLPSPARARAYLERARDAADAAGVPDATRAALLRDLADTAATTGDYALAADELHQALALTDEPLERTALLRRLGDVLARWGRFDEAEAAYEEGVVALQADPDPALAGELYAGLAMLSCERDDLDAAADLAELALTFAAAGDDPVELAWAHHRMGVVAVRRGQLDVARTHANESLVAFVGLGRPDGEAGARTTLGLTAAASGDLDDAVAQLTRAVELFEQSGNEHGSARALDNLADALHRCGRDDEAFECLERAVTILARIGLGEDAVYGSMWRAGAW